MAEPGTPPWTPPCDDVAPVKRKRHACKRDGCGKARDLASPELGCRCCRCEDEDCEHGPGCCGILLTPREVKASQKRCTNCNSSLSLRRKHARADSAVHYWQQSVMELEGRAESAESAVKAAQEESQAERQAREKAEQDAAESARQLAASEQKAKETAEAEAIAWQQSVMELEKQKEEAQAEVQRARQQLEDLLRNARASEAGAMAPAISQLATPSLNLNAVWGRGCKLGHKIGEGGYGKVSFMLLVGGPQVAVKKCCEDKSARDSQSLKEMEYLLTEVKLLHACAACPNVIRVYGLIGSTAPWNAFAMEAADMDLHMRIALLPRPRSPGQKSPNRSRTRHDPAPRPWSMMEREVIAIGVASGLEFLHGLGIVHCDLKLQNIFLSGGIAKLADFGIANYRPLHRFDQPKLPRLCEKGGSLYWLSPEHYHALALMSAYEDYRVSAKCNDVWAFGCILECLGASILQPSHVDAWLPRTGPNDLASASPKASNFFRNPAFWKPAMVPEELLWSDVLATTLLPKARNRPAMSIVRGALVGKLQLHAPESTRSAEQMAMWDSVGPLMTKRAERWESYIESALS